MKRSAAFLICFGLVLLGFSSAAYSSGGAEDAAATTTAAQASTCTAADVTGASLSFAGSSAQASFTVGAGCAPLELSLVSYTSPSASFDQSTAEQQVLYDATTATLGPGSHTLSVAVPACFFQVDLVVGAPLQHLGPEGSGNFYTQQGRLIVSALGGASVCSSTTTISTTTAPTTTTNPTTTTAPTTTSTAAATTVPPPATTPPTTTTVVSSTPAAPPLTTTAAPPPTTVPATGTTETETTLTIPVENTTTRDSGAGPPSGSPPAPPGSTGSPGLPFTGLALRAIVTIGVVLLFAGLILLAAARFPFSPEPAFVPAFAYGAPTRVRRARFESPPRPIDYRVYVPGVGRFESIDQAEQKALDRRWAREGARFMGRREERRDS